MAVVRIVPRIYDWNRDEPPGSPVRGNADLEVIRWALRRGAQRVERAIGQDRYDIGAGGTTTGLDR
jgi:hypothetical protein